MAGIYACNGGGRDNKGYSDWYNEKGVAVLEEHSVHLPIAAGTVEQHIFLFFYIYFFPLPHPFAIFGAALKADDRKNK